MASERTDPDPMASCTVFYDGSCPVCSREINFYRDRPGATEIDWVDVSNPLEANQKLPKSLNQSDAMARFHVQTQDGNIRSGAGAFLTLWKNLPQFKTLARILDFRPVVWVLDRVYDGFLVIRPAMKRTFSKS